MMKAAGLLAVGFDVVNAINVRSIVNAKITRNLNTTTFIGWTLISGGLICLFKLLPKDVKQLFWGLLWSVAIIIHLSTMPSGCTPSSDHEYEWDASHVKD